MYWDDRAKLAEILEELRSRLEPEAATLFRTVAGRIDLLRRDPEAAKLQPPPTLHAAAAEPAASPPAAVAKPRRRAVVIMVAGAAAAVSVWLLWPHTALPPVPTAAVPGPEVALNGHRPELPPKPPAVPPSAPSATSSPIEVEPLPPLVRPPVAGGNDGATGDAVEVPLPASRPPRAAASHAADKDSPAAKAAAEALAAADDAAASARDAVGRTPRPGAADRSTESAERFNRPRSGAADSGIAIDEATLTCYRTDSNPDACGGGAASAANGEAPAPPPAARDDGPPPAASAAAPDAPASAPAGASGAAGPSASASPSSSAAPPGASADGGSPAGGGGSSSGGSAGGGGGSSSGGGSASAADKADKTDEANQADKADKSEQQPPPKAVLAAAAAPAAAAPPPSCSPAPASGRVVFILDGSISMGLPLGVDGHLEDRLDDGIRHHNLAARREYRALLAEPGPKRITRARVAFAEAAADLPPKVDLGLVVFQECRDIRKIGVFDAAHRARAVDYVRRIVPRGRTPIADSLRRAAEMLGKGRSSIVLLTDGREFCGGDPCAAAAEIKKAHPHTPVSIVDITGEAKAECVAEITGGRSYKPEAADDLARVVSAAFRNADPGCAAEPAPAAKSKLTPSKAAATPPAATPHP